MNMDYKQILEHLGYVDGVDFQLTEESFEMLPKLRMVFTESGEEAQEEYTPEPPSQVELEERQASIQLSAYPITDLINEYLKDKAELRTEQDSLAILKNKISGWSFPNIPAPSQVELAALIAPMEAERAKKARIAEKMKLGEASDKACTDAFKVIQGYNIDRELTSAQKTEMETLFAPALQAIAVKRPSVLKAYISSIEPDGILVTQEMKEDVLEVLKDF